jgi:predicted dehydrogenase
VTDLRFGLIGAGMMGREHIANLVHLDDVVFVSMADPDRGSLELSGQMVPEAARYEDYRRMIDNEDLDAVVVASPNHTHVDVLLDLMPTDLHIMVEKPLCITVEECRRVVAAQQSRAAMTWMGLEYRYMPPIARLVAEVRAGTVGDVKMVAIREHRYPFLVKVGDWNRLQRNTGGTLVEKCCHFFDMMCLITGQRPVRVMASGSQDVNFLDEVYGGEPADMIDNAYVIVDFDGGARGLLDLCMFAEGSKNEQEVAVTGDLGKVEAFLPESIVRVGARTDGHDVAEFPVHDDRIRVPGSHWGSSYLELLEFAEAIRDGTPPKVTLDEGLMSVAIGVAGERSIAEGRPVTMSEVL